MQSTKRFGRTLDSIPRDFQIYLLVLNISQTPFSRKHLNLLSPISPNCQRTTLQTGSNYLQDIIYQSLRLNDCFHEPTTTHLEQRRSLFSRIYETSAFLPEKAFYKLRFSLSKLAINFGAFVNIESWPQRMKTRYYPMYI